LAIALERLQRDHVGKAVRHAVLGFEQGHEFLVLGQFARTEDLEPFLQRFAGLLAQTGDHRGFHFFRGFGHVRVLQEFHAERRCRMQNVGVAS
jgi:hypothetical protein